MDNQLMTIQLGKQVLGLDDETYIRLLTDMFGKPNIIDLTNQEQSELLDRFKLLGYRPKKYSVIAQ